MALPVEFLKSNFKKSSFLKKKNFDFEEKKFRIFEEKKIRIFEEEKNLEFFKPMSPCRATHEFTQKMSAHSVQPFGRPEGTYVRMSCFIIYVH